MRPALIDGAGTCVECGSRFQRTTTTMTELCPECAYWLYGKPRCSHLMDDGPCKNCGWDGSVSPYTDAIKKNFVVPYHCPTISGFIKGRVSAVLIRAGNSITIDLPLLELKNDDVECILPSPFEGTVVRVHLEPGDVIEWGTRILDYIAFAPDDSPHEQKA